jgi:hypothetical protein
MFEKGELGINENENRNHWPDALRFKRTLSDSRKEPDNSATGRIAGLDVTMCNVTPHEAHSAEKGSVDCFVG